MRRNPVSVPTDPDTGAPLPLCSYCRRLESGAARRCAAFPDGIPAAVWSLDQLHDRPIPGDRGIQFDPWTQEELDDQVRAGFLWRKF